MNVTHLLERSEANRVRGKVEHVVLVLHEGITEKPDIAAKTQILSDEGTNALRRTGGRQTEIEAKK